MPIKKIRMPNKDNPGSELQEIRQKIDHLDEQLVRLLDRRARFVFQIGEWKKRNSYKVYDPKRESEILARISKRPHQYIQNSELQSLFKLIIDFFRNIENARSLILSANLPEKANVCFFGFGLMGASIGLALTKRFPRWKMKICDPYMDVSEFQGWNKKIGQGAFDIINASQIKNFDYVFLSAPVHVNNKNGPLIAKKNSCVLNLGSVQSSLEGVCGFHPLAGKETSKFYSAQANLFYGKTICLTNTENLKSENLEKIKSIAHALGAEVWITDSQQHNEILAYTSHLIQILSMAFGLCLDNQKIDQQIPMIPSTAKDFLRLTGSRPEMWQPIFIENKKLILKAITDFESQLKDIKNCLSKPSKIEKLFIKSYQIYQNIYLKGRAS